MGLSHLSLLQMSFSGAIFITVIIMLRTVAIDRLPKKMFLVLWGVALLRLLVPLSVPSAVSVYSVVSRNVDADTLEQIPIQNIIPITPEQQGQPGDWISNTVEAQPVQPGQTAQISDYRPSVSVWFIAWCAGMVLCAVFFVTFYLRWHFKFGTSVPVHNDYIEQWLEEHGLRRRISIRQSDRIAAPLTYGVFRPVILLPKKTDWENTEQLQYVLLHEYVHICRFDTVTKFITATAVCIHWFNPFVWAMYVLFNRDLELSCDESVVRLLGISSRSTYARVLISMEARKSGLMPFYNNFSKNAIEKRITSIMKIKKTSLLAILTAIIVVGGITSVFVTSARSAQGDGGADADLSEWTINSQLISYMEMTYGQFRGQTGRTAESYHAHYFQAPIPGMEADAVFGGNYDEELGGPILADDDELVRIEVSLDTIVNGITEEMPAAEFVTAFDEATGALRAIVVNDGGGTAYYVADNYMEIEFDSNGDNLEDALLQIALDESNNVGPDSYTWLVKLDSSAGSDIERYNSQDDENDNDIIKELYFDTFDTGTMSIREESAVNPDELAEIFGISISLPENPTWIANSEYYLLSKDHLKITYHDAITDSDCVLLVARNENLILPENEYDERLDESWEARTINGQNIVVKVQRGKNESKAVLATWEYNEYQFAIIGEIEGEADSGPIAKVALSIIRDLS